LCAQANSCKPNPHPRPLASHAPCAIPSRRTPLASSSPRQKSMRPDTTSAPHAPSCAWPLATHAARTLVAHDPLKAGPGVRMGDRVSSCAVAYMTPCPAATAAPRPGRGSAGRGTSAAPTGTPQRVVLLRRRSRAAAHCRAASPSTCAPQPRRDLARRAPHRRGMLAPSVQQHVRPTPPVSNAQAAPARPQTALQAPMGPRLLRTVKCYLQAVGTVAPPSDTLCLPLSTCLSIYITRAAQITPPSCMRAGTQAAACLLYDTASVLSNQSAHRRRAASAALLRKPATPRSCSSSAPATRRTSRVPLAPAVAASPALCNGGVRAAVWLCWYFRMVQSKT